MKGRILVAMSGGVDSSAAAVCLRNEGYSIAGATMVMFDSCEVPCASEDGAKDAEAACNRLGMDFHLIDAKAPFKEYVMGSFVNSYLAGETPNPCIVCNNKLKFGLFLDYALEKGFDKIATGHYAKIKKQGERYLLVRGEDRNKDQSYVLYSLTQKALSHLVLPLGELSKAEVRELAADVGLSNADKKESQDICFVPDGDYASFIERRVGCVQHGEFALSDGTVIGEHKGIIRYTIGQHKKLGLGIHIPYYVLKKDAAANRIILGSNEDLFQKNVRAEEMNWIACDTPTHPIRVKAKLRYRHTEQDATVYADEDGRATIVFDEAQRAITPGQAVVLYDGDVVVGGGKISNF